MFPMDLPPAMLSVESIHSVPNLALGAPSSKSLINPTAGFDGAAGLGAVIASRLPEIAGYGDLIYLADGVEEFAAQLDLALKESNPELRDKRAAFATLNSWSRRVEQLQQAIREAPV